MAITHTAQYILAHFANLFGLSVLASFGELPLLLAKERLNFSKTPTLKTSEKYSRVGLYQRLCGTKRASDATDKRSRAVLYFTHSDLHVDGELRRFALVILSGATDAAFEKSLILPFKHRRNGRFMLILLTILPNA